MKLNKILVTGSSGFIGMHLCESLLKDGYEVIGIDNMNKYYDVQLKIDRLNKLLSYPNFTFRKVDLFNKKKLNEIFKESTPYKVVNLGAQAGVRYSLINPTAYIRSNVNGFLNILEACKEHEVRGLIYASSSSIYGKNKKSPFKEIDRTDLPISIYAASKRTNELMAYTYNHLFNLKTTGLRFFSVYGPWGRPDMAIYIFTKKISKGLPIQVFNQGDMSRDYTFIGDVVQGIRSALDKNYNFEIFNLGNNRVVNLLDLIQLIEERLRKKATIEMCEMQPGDVKTTYADIDYARHKLGYSPKTEIKEGLKSFVDWYLVYNT